MWIVLFALVWGVKEGLYCLTYLHTYESSFLTLTVADQMYADISTVEGKYLMPLSVKI